VTGGSGHDHQHRSGPYELAADGLDVDPAEAAVTAAGRGADIHPCL